MSRLAGIAPPVVRFGREPEFQQEVSSLMSATRGGAVTCHVLGESEEGRPLVGYVAGSGPRAVSLIAGSHSDEPVGPETLRALVRAFILRPELYARYLERFTFVIVPHVNPDGEARNAPWINRWPSVDAYLSGAFRELPGRDMEFGYPDLRVENGAVARFLDSHSPYVLHVSLHGMGFSDGALLLIDRLNADRAGELRRGFVELAERYGFDLHDHDRGGDKGFEYLGPGFTTTPRGDAMREHFEALGDSETANLFRHSSMEFVESLGGRPLSLVTELPLFVITAAKDLDRPGKPLTYLSLRELLPEARLAASNGSSAALLERFGLEPVPLASAVRMQSEVLDLGLATVADWHP